MAEFGIRITDLIKDYEVYPRPVDLVIETIFKKNRHSHFRALDNVSFEVKKGEVLGIIGNNGAGKSTLLKIITGVLEKSSGDVEIRGKVTAILELGIGFNLEYSGRDNVYLSGLLYGMPREEIDRKITSIIDFSGLNEFIDRPMKTYSSGMQSRLAFSVATAAEPDILIIDEALATGDAMFVQKCMSRIHNLCKGGRTVLLVSHGTGMLAQLCDRVLWLERGRVKQLGDALEVVQAYDLAVHQGANSGSWIDFEEAALQAPIINEPLVGIPDPSSESPFYNSVNKAPVYRRGPVFIERVELLDKNKVPTSRLATLESFTLRIHYKCEGPPPADTVGVSLAINRKHDLASVAQWFTQNRFPGESRSEYDIQSYRVAPFSRGTISVEYRELPLSSGDYLLSVGLLANQPGVWDFYEYRHLFYPLSVTDGGLDVGAPIFMQPARFFHHHSEAQAPAKIEHRTLKEEVTHICVTEGGYPISWDKHYDCPACGQGPMLDAFKKKGFTHSRCAICDFVCVNPYPPKEVLDKLYAGQYYTELRENYEAWRLSNGESATTYSAPQDILLDIIADVAPANSRGTWLDVGGGTGEFANLISKQRPLWNVKLNEHNPRSIELAHSIFGLQVVSGDETALLGAGEQLDVISSLNVLEHTTDPLSFVKSYARLLKPGGTLITVVPNFSPLNSSVSRAANSNVEPPFHASLFNSNNLERLLRRSGCFQSVSVMDRGPPAFSLIEHVNFGDHYDVTISTPEHREPIGIKTKEFSELEIRTLNALSVAQKEVGDFFSQVDGRLYLIAYAKARS